MSRQSIFSFLFLLLLQQHVAVRALISSKPVSTLLQENAELIAKLKSITTEQIGSIDAEPYSNDVFYLRYCLEGAKDENPQQAAEETLIENLTWRQGALGQKITNAALHAVADATAQGGWNNDVVTAAAPYSEQITKYLTPDNAITTTSSQGDLIYCIRAGAIDDNALMSAVTVDQMKEFFLFAKEVNYLVCLQRSRDTDKLVSILTANDLSGVKLIGGSKDFRTALSASSKESASLYPATNGPTLLLNLPPVLSALVTIFKQLLPESVKARLRFEQGPLSKVTSLSEVTSGDSRTEFLNQIDELVY